MLPVKPQNDEARSQNCYLTNIISNNNNIEQQQAITALFEKKKEKKKTKYNSSTVDM